MVNHLFFSLISSVNYLLVVLERKAQNLNEEEAEIEENVNRLSIEGASARTVDDAIHVLQ